MLFGHHKRKMITLDKALPGRGQPAFTIPTRHAVLGTPIQPPFPDGLRTAVFAFGCFWGAESLFWQTEGVYTTAVGYAGGFTPNPTYREVCSGRTGHAEAVLAVFDPAKVSYADLLAVFFEAHDPTQGMRQGNDSGTQYRSAVYYADDIQRRATEATRTTTLCGAPASARSPRRSAPPAPSTTPRTTINSTCIRCRVATAAWRGPAWPARPR